MKKTLVIGANANPSRYSYIATELLKSYHHEVVPFGNRPGEINGTKIETEFPAAPGEFDTVTLYINPTLQEQYYERIINLKPKRIIFNPGTENEAFEKMARNNGIKAEEACTLVLLHTNQY